MKQKISIAAGSLKPKDMSRTHYTTLGFGCPFPIFVEETIPKDKFSFKVSNFSRLAPMFLPNLGTLNLKIHAFYVPFRLVWNHFENFREGLPSWNNAGAQVFKNVPFIDDYSLSQIFLTALADGTKLAELNQDQSNLCDFYLNNSADGYNFTLRGKQVYHMLVALGYNFKFTDNSTANLETLNTKYSMLPLLCWLKIFLDYFIPSQFQPSSQINALFNYIHEMDTTDISSPVNTQYLTDCLNEVMLYYQNNYFTSAWMYPNSPVSGLNNIGTTTTDSPVINSVHSQGGQLSFSSQNLVNSDDSVARPPYTNNSYSINVENAQRLTADGLTFLQKFARFVKRSNFAGSRAVERILARFGVKVDDFQIGMCRYLGSETLTLQKSDVTVTGSSAEAGDYTGKGFFSGGSDRIFKCDCDYSGMMIVSASLETPSTYLEGVRRRNIHLTPLDFYTPELDGGTMQAISGQEVFSRCTFLDTNTASQLSSLKFGRSDVYGFTPRFSEYKMALDDVSGDFNLFRYNASLDPFILPRRIFDIDQIRTELAAGSFGSLNVRDMVYDESLKTTTPSPVRSLFSNDQSQFNRIFRDTTGLADPVFSVFRIDCLVHSVSVPLNESAEIQGRGKSLDFETNGVHLS